MEFLFYFWNQEKAIGMVSSDYTHCGLCVKRNTLLWSLIQLRSLKAQHDNLNLSKYMWIFNYMLHKFKMSCWAFRLLSELKDEDIIYTYKYTYI